MKKLKAGILGFGGIGHFHSSCYVGQPYCELIAIADIRPEQLQTTTSSINLGTSAETDIAKLHAYSGFEAMLQHEQLDFIDICVPTWLHSKYTIMALKAGLHVLCEKPMARTLAQADAMLQTALACGKTLMIGQCLRFAPDYCFLKDAYDSGKYGKLLSLDMRRTSSLPTGADNWFRNGELSGGALLDMHIHDTDFVNYLLGMPDAVITSGTTHYTNAIDDSMTLYIYRGGPSVSAGTSWSHGNFSAGFTAIFEDATIATVSDGLLLYRLDQKPEQITPPKRDGCYEEINYFAECIRNSPPQICSPTSTRDTLRIALAEEKSARNGARRISLR